MTAKVNPAERSETAKAVRTELDDAACLINAVNARVLTQVITAQTWKVHRDLDGFSSLRDWLMTRFDFHYKVAADIAAIARSANKFGVLTAAATTGAARVDQVAFAIRALDKTAALRLYARTPYRQSMPSPFDPAVSCPTPEHLAAQYCIHAPHNELARHLAEIEAACTAEDELFEGLSEQALARLEVTETDSGMWAVDGLLSSDTGALFAKMLTTAVPPPRAEDCQTEPELQAGTDSETGAEPALPPQANRNAEALHQMLTVYGADPRAPTRHGHTSTLHLSVDLDTLRGEETGRYPTLEGRPISVAKARLLTCEAGVIPSIFDYTTGEAIELGRTARLPNAALRRKLELEQPGGCAWRGCSRPIQWTEAHHLVHWADGGETVAENLILLCRFHHGRIHTPGWSISKTGPGRAVIVHHEGHEAAPADVTEAGQADCGCADWRTDADLDTDFQDDLSNVFPTGLYPEEWAETLKADLNRIAEQHELDRAWAAAKAARAKARVRFTTEATKTAARTQAEAGPPETERSPQGTPGPEPDSELASAYAAAGSDPGPPPYLTGPAGRSAGASIVPQPELQNWVGPLAMPDSGQPPRAAPTTDRR